MTSYPTVQGVCPMGCGPNLALDQEGHVRCLVDACPRPGAADQLLHLEPGHFVVFSDDGFVVEHPASERLAGTMADCPLLATIADSFDPGDELPCPPGRYTATRVDDGRWHLAPVTP